MSYASYQKAIIATAFFASSMISQRVHAETVLSITQTAYDSNDRVVCSAVRLNLATTATDACALGAEDTVNNWGPDRISRTVYDADGNVIEVTRAAGTAVEQLYATYTYTENGKKASEADANGNVTRLVYDGFDRLQYMYYPSPSVTHAAAPCSATAETWCGGTAPYTARAVNTVGKPPLGVASTTDYEMFGYNANGSTTSWRRRNGQTKYYGYDRLNRVVHENGSTGPNVYISYDLQSHVCDNIPGSDTASSGDDCTDRMTAVTTAGIHNRYDKAGRLLATKDANGRSLAYSYDAAGRRTSLTYPDSVVQGYQYNVDGSLKWSGVSATTVGLTLTYDTRGRLISLTRSNGANSAIGYDDLSRPLSLKHTLTNPTYNADWAFVYNPASQVRSVTAPQTYDYLEKSASVSTPTYDGLNRDTGIANQTTTCGNATDGYDCNGNLTYEGTGGRTFTYDIDNRLLTATGGSAPLTLSYDAVGRLSSYTAGSTTTQFLYDGPNLVAEYQGGVLVKRYMHTTGVDQPFMEFSGTGTAAANANFPLANYQGSIIAVSDSTGNVAAANVYKYSPYGEPTNGTDTATWAGERFRYTGQIALPEARLYYYKARVYDPVYGRFLQTDPIGSKDDLDLYAYVGGDPVNKSDPTGLDACNGGHTWCPDGTNEKARLDSWLLIASPVSSIFLGNNTEAQRIYLDWERGVGPSRRDYGADSSFSMNFAASRYTQRQVDIALRAWSSRDRGNITGDFTRCCRNQRYVIGEGNQAGELVGSFALDGHRDGNEIEWTATNTVSRNSFFGGNWLNIIHLKGASNRTEGPRKSITMTVKFRTDLEGNIKGPGCREMSGGEGVSCNY